MLLARRSPRCLLTRSPDPRNLPSSQPYLETQSESLISAIQTLLASVRSGSPATELRENLSSVIVIGSSIVGVSKDSLPLRAVGEGRRLLRALAGNCELLSELSEGEEMGKDVRNQIATTTFELAKVRARPSLPSAPL